MFFPLYTLLRLCIPLYVCVLSCSRMSNSLVTPWTAACQAPLSMGFPKQEYWRALPFPPPGESSQHRDQTQVVCIAGGFFTAESPGKPWIEDMRACECALSHFSRVWFFEMQKPHQAPGPWDSPGKNLEWAAMPSSGLNPCLLCLLHWQMGSLPLLPPRSLDRGYQTLSWWEQIPHLILAKMPRHRKD